MSLLMVVFMAVLALASVPFLYPRAANKLRGLQFPERDNRVDDVVKGVNLGAFFGFGVIFALSFITGESAAVLPMAVFALASLILNVAHELYLARRLRSLPSIH